MSDIIETQKSFIPKDTDFCYAERTKLGERDGVPPYLPIMDVPTIEQEYRTDMKVRGLCPFWAVEARPMGVMKNTLPNGRCLFMNTTDEQLDREGKKGELYELRKCCGVSTKTSNE